MRTDLKLCDLPFIDRQKFKWRVNTDTRLNASAKLVLDCLIMHVNCKFEECYPGQPLICAETAMAEGTVRSALKSLRDFGWITWRSAENGGYVYRILWDANPEIVLKSHVRQTPETPSNSEGDEVASTPSNPEGAPPQNSRGNIQTEVTKGPNEVLTASPTEPRARSPEKPSHSAEKEALKKTKGTREWWLDQVFTVQGEALKASYYPGLSKKAFRERLGAVLKRERWDLRKVEAAMRETMAAEPSGDAFEYLAGVLRQDGAKRVVPMDEFDPRRRPDYSKPAPDGSIM